MGNLPFERTRYNPVQDVTSDEAERYKCQEAEQRAAFRDPKAGDGAKSGEEDVPAHDADKATD